MSLWKIAWRSIQQRALASGLTAFSMALGVALVVAVMGILGVINDSFRSNAEGFDIIVGAKGGKLQLVLNTVYHLSTPVENIPYSFYKEFTGEGRYASQVDVAIPYCLGDNYEGYRVVGTTPQLFDIEYAQGRSYHFADGENFKPSDYFAAVIGSRVAKATGLRVGSKFEPTHGVADDGQGHKHDAFHVVGVLEPTGTANDRALFVNIEGFYLLAGHALEEPRGNDDHDNHGHEEHAHDGDAGHDDDHDADHAHGDEEDKDAAEAAATTAVAAAPDNEGHDHDDHAHDDEAGAAHDEHGHEENEHAGHAHDEHDQGHAHDGHDHAHHHHEPLPEELREVTSVLIRTSNPLAPMYLIQSVNEGQTAQAVLPTREIYTLLDGVVGNLETLLLALAVLIVVVAGIGILVSIYNSMSDRRRDIAVMRALGAGRRTVLSIILAESVLLSVGGGVAGFLLGRLLIISLTPVLAAQTGVSLGFLQFLPYTINLGDSSVVLPSVELLLIPALVVVAALVGYLPAVSAYRTDVAKALTANP